MESLNIEPDFGLGEKAQHKGRALADYLLRRCRSTRVPYERWIDRVLADKDGYVVLEHPKCGRTWLRFMIYQAESVVYRVPVRNLLKSICYPGLGLPRLQFTHGFEPLVPLDDFHLNVDPASPRQRGYLFILRAPERVMISYYHHVRYRDGKFTGPIGEFIRHPGWGMENYAGYVDRYLSELAGLNHLVLRYEDMRADTFGQLSRVLDFIGLDLAPETVRAIIENSTFERMKAMERSGGFGVEFLRAKSKKDERTFKVRSGGAESLSDFFTPRDLEYMRSVYGKSAYFKEYGYVD